MARWRRIRKWGDSLVLVFSPTDVLDLGIKIGDWGDIEKMIIVDQKVKDLKKLTKIKEVKNGTTKN